METSLQGSSRNIAIPSEVSNNLTLESMLHFSICGHIHGDNVLQYVVCLLLGTVKPMSLLSPLPSGSSLSYNKSWYPSSSFEVLLPKKLFCCVGMLNQLDIFVQSQVVLEENIDLEGYVFQVKLLLISNRSEVGKAFIGWSLCWIKVNIWTKLVIILVKLVRFCNQ